MSARKTRRPDTASMRRTAHLGAAAGSFVVPYQLHQFHDIAPALSVVAGLALATALFALLRWWVPKQPSGYSGFGVLGLTPFVVPFLSFWVGWIVLLVVVYLAYALATAGYAPGRKPEG